MKAVAALLVVALATSPIVAQEREDGDLLESVEAVQRNLFRTQAVKLRALDKITGRFTDFELEVGDPKVYGSLRIDLDVCFQTPPEEIPESAAFLRVVAANSKQVQTMAVPRALTNVEIAEPEDEDMVKHFSGWMYASSPGLSALEHPVYDVWVINCIADEPDTSFSGQE